MDKYVVTQCKYKWQNVLISKNENADGTELLIIRWLIIITANSCLENKKLETFGSYNKACLSKVIGKGKVSGIEGLSGMRFHKGRNDELLREKSGKKILKIEIFLPLFFPLWHFFSNGYPDLVESFYITIDVDFQTKKWIYWGKNEKK